MKKWLCLILACLMLLPAIVACSNTGKTPADSTTKAPEGSVTTSPDDEPEFDPKSLIVNADYSGQEFRMLYRTEGRPEYVSLYAEELTGDEMVKEIFERNSKIEDLYHIKLSVVEDSNPYQVLGTSYMSGSDDYEAVWDRFKNLVGIAPAGYLANLRSIDGLNLEQDWWDQNANDAFTFFGEKLYFTCNDINVQDLYYTTAMYANLDIVQQFSLDNPYTLVLNGQWTLDKMYEMMNVVKGDDGDGIRNVGDRFGLVTGVGQYMTMLNGAGANLVVREDEETYTNLTGSETVIRVTEKIASMLNDTTTSVIVNTDKWGYDTFYNGNTLFYVMFIYSLYSFKDLLSNYAILPMPMYDEAQDYYTCAITDTAHAFCIPSVSQHRESTANIIEAMNIYSHLSLVGTYYHVVLEGKMAQDPDSVEMLDIIYANRSYDYGFVFDTVWNKVWNQYLSSVRASGAANLASLYESTNEAYEITVKAQLEQYRNLPAD